MHIDWQLVKDGATFLFLVWGLFFLMYLPLNLLIIIEFIYKKIKEHRNKTNNNDD